MSVCTQLKTTPFTILIILDKGESFFLLKERERERQKKAHFKLLSLCVCACLFLFLSLSLFIIARARERERKSSCLFVLFLLFPLLCFPLTESAQIFYLGFCQKSLKNSSGEERARKRESVTQNARLPPQHETRAEEIESEREKRCLLKKKRRKM